VVRIQDILDFSLGTCHYPGSLLLQEHTHAGVAMAPAAVEGCGKFFHVKLARRIGTLNSRPTSQPASTSCGPGGSAKSGWVKMPGKEMLRHGHQGLARPRDAVDARPATTASGSTPALIPIVNVSAQRG